MTQKKEPPLVLVVDDTEANLDLMVEVLGDTYEVAVAVEGESALEAAEENPPELILLDIMMPGMDGYEVCRRLKDNPATRDIPVIFVTAKTETTDEARGFALGAVDYITKPISPPIVLARVATHLRLHRQNRKLAQQNRLLKKYTRMRDDVERMTRHDLKSPLSAVINVPDMLLEEAQLTPDQRELLQMLQESGYRMLNIINSSLDMYKMETGRYQYSPEPVDVLRVINQIKGETRELMHQKGISVLFMLGARPARTGDALWVQGEAMLLYTMLANLIKNAVEASPSGESITVSLEPGDPSVVRIHNQGEVPQKIKNRFFQKYTTAGKKGGTGLGTYNAKLIAQTLQGSIAMISSAEDGTLLTVKLPASPRDGETDEPNVIESPLQAAASPAPAIPAAAQQEDSGVQAVDIASVFAGKPMAAAWPDLGITIMVVDDYSNMRRITKAALRHMGYTNLLEAENGESAWRQVKTQRVDLIISDVNMPEMNGIELLQTVRSDPQTAGTPFIIITGEAQQNTIQAAAQANVSDYILKPYSPDILKAKIDGVMRKARMR